MSLAYNPYGLQPILNQSGIIRQAPTPGVIASGYAVNLFQYTPVQIDSTTPTGNLVIAPAMGAGSATPTVANRLIGSFEGVEFTLTATGRRTVSNMWPANTVATNIVAWYTRDPYLTYQIQANGPVNQLNLGYQASITTNGTANGNTTTGFSTVGLDVTTANSLVGPGTQPTFFNQLRIVGFSQAIDNNVGDAFTVVQVQISLHQDVANQLPY
jgi:hypothetical protein